MRPSAWQHCGGSSAESWRGEGGGVCAGARLAHVGKLTLQLSSLSAFPSFELNRSLLVIVPEFTETLYEWQRIK